MYGVENVARIVAWGTLAPRNVTRKVFSAFDHPQSFISKISGLIPTTVKTIKKALEVSEELRGYKSKYPTEFAVIERLEGRICSRSKHAGGIIIYPNLSSYLPLHTESDDRNKRVASFDMDVLHELGFFKFDCLGLKSLEVLKMTLDAIHQDTGEMLKLDDIDMEDESVYNDLCDGKVNGCFQIEEQRSKIMEQQPKNFRDIIAINALIRPGVADWEEYIARRNGKEWSCHEDRMPYLAETYGLLVYQEQYLLDCKTFAGWSIAFADAKVRKNKDIKNDTDLAQKFLDDGHRMGYDAQVLEQVWSEIVASVDGGYGFNKSHATAYGVITYRTAYLKHYYPQYFFSALLTRKNEAQDADVQLSNLIAEVKRENVEILPPHINKSSDNFLPTKEGILYSLTAIKGLGEKALEHFYKLRPIISLSDLYERRERKSFRSNNFEALIKAGVFDFENKNRVELLNKFYEMDKSKKKCELKWNTDTKMLFEEDAFGLYLSKHPMEKYGFKSILEYGDNEECLVAGKILKVAEIFDKKGNKMAFVTISNQYENIKCLVFATTWNDKKKCDHEEYTEGNIIMVKGRRSGKDCLINSIEVLEWHKGEEENE